MHLKIQYIKTLLFDGASQNCHPTFACQASEINSYFVLTVCSPGCQVHRANGYRCTPRHYDNGQEFFQFWPTGLSTWVPVFSPDLVLRFSALDVTQPNLELAPIRGRLRPIPFLYLPSSVPDPPLRLSCFTGLGVSSMPLTWLTAAETPSAAWQTSVGPFSVLSSLHPIAIKISN